MMIITQTSLFKMEKLSAGAILIALFGSSVVTALIGHFFTRSRSAAETKKLKAETVLTATQIYENLVADLRLEITRLKDKMDKMEDREQLQHHIHGSMLERENLLHQKISALEEENRQLRAELVQFRNK